MPVFREVEGERAGPEALGILVPPGRRTLVIVRPRALDCDLIPVDASGNGHDTKLWEVGRHQAAELVRHLHHALEEDASRRAGRVEAMASPSGEGYRVLAAIGPFTLIACHRRPGQPYQPLVLATVEEARQRAERIAAVLCPTVPGGQELYFNTRQFAR
ncbi:MAG TPA: hypothetical protein VG013_38475 [Gemmataceae bacterium]|jgi:hypothetical protein|nr:hypothetical protein [Gemmataceae bacterium]